VCGGKEAVDGVLCGDCSWERFVLLLRLYYGKWWERWVEEV